MAEPVPSRPPSARAEWVDVAKGIGIVLVVAGHAVDGLLASALVPRGGGWATAHYVVYTFHMPLFFLLAGLFVQQRIDTDTPAFGRSLVGRIVWPYFLWSTLQLVAIWAMADRVNVPFQWDAFRLVALIWIPTSQFWFLHALFLMSVVVLLLGSKGQLRWWLLIAAGLRVLPEVFELPWVLQRFCTFAIWHALGVAGAGLLQQRLALAPGAWRIAGLMAGLLLLLGFGLPPPAGGGSYWGLMELPAAIGGVLAALTLATLSPMRQWGLLAYLGSRSMSIFLLHVFFTAGVRILFVALGWAAHTGPMLLLAVLGGLLGPLLVLWASTQLGLNRALGLGA